MQAPIFSYSKLRPPTAKVIYEHNTERLATSQTQPRAGRGHSPGPGARMREEHARMSTDNDGNHHHAHGIILREATRVQSPFESLFYR